LLFIVPPLLQLFFRDETGKGRSQGELYDLVQHAGNIVPRLYLLCTAGACYIRGGEAPAKLILRDVVEMCKGVQHPTRGLFLRAYLVQARPRPAPPAPALCGRSRAQPSWPVCDTQE
jgi:vacuolar protein sorting-associated protein 35